MTVNTRLATVLSSARDAWSALSDDSRTAVAIFAFRITLDVSYVSTVSRWWAYMSMPLDPDPIRYVESMAVLALLTAVLLRSAPREPTPRFLLTSLLMLALVPVSTYFSLAGATRSSFYLMALSFIITAVAARAPIPVPRAPRFGPMAAVVGSVLAVGVSTVWLVSQGALANFNLDMSRVYELREESPALLDAGAWAYINAWSFKMFNVSLLVYSLLRRRFDLFVVLFALQVMFFGVSSHKSLLFYPPLVLAIMLVFRMRAPHRTALWGMAVTTLTGVALAAIGSVLFASLLTRRLLMVPAVIAFGVYDFFGSTSLVMMSNGILARFFEYPFPSPTPRMTSQFLFGHGDTWSNSSYIATGFMHFGVAGVVGFAIAVGLMIALVRSVSASDLPHWAATGLVIVPFVILFTSSDLGTAVLTHGLGPALVVLWLYTGYVPNQRSHRVVHLSTVHPAEDTRVTHLECRALAESGLDVTLIARADAPAVTPHGVRIVPVGDARNRLSRMTLGVVRAYRLAVKERPSVCHIHDPELLSIAWLLRARGIDVVYDVHEDVPIQVLSKDWIPEGLRPVVGSAYRFAERVLTLGCSRIICAVPELAPRYPRRKTSVVQNFPTLDVFGEPPDYDSRRPDTVAYVGGVSRTRGIHTMLDAVAALAARRDVHLLLAGPIRPDGLRTDLELHPAWKHTEYQPWATRPEVVRMTHEARVGLVVLPPRENYVESWPVKLFEYMAAGLPVVASDFPLWREIIETAGCGVVVDPQDPGAIAEAVDAILSDPEKARGYGVAGRRAAMQRYNWDTQSAVLLDVYAGLGVEPDHSDSITRPVLETSG